MREGSRYACVQLVPPVSPNGTPSEVVDLHTPPPGPSHCLRARGGGSLLECHVWARPLANALHTTHSNPSSAHRQKKYPNSGLRGFVCGHRGAGTSSINSTHPHRGRIPSTHLPPPSTKPGDCYTTVASPSLQTVPYGGLDVPFRGGESVPACTHARCPCPPLPASHAMTSRADSAPSSSQRAPALCIPYVEGCGVGSLWSVARGRDRLVGGRGDPGEWRARVRRDSSTIGATRARANRGGGL